MDASEELTDKVTLVDFVSKTSCSHSKLPVKMKDVSVFLNMSYQISESERIPASIARYKRRLRNAKMEPDPVKRDLLTKICYIKISSARIKLEIRRLRYLP